MALAFKEVYNEEHQRITILKEDIDYYLDHLVNHINYWLEEYKKQPVFIIDYKRKRGTIDFGSGCISFYMSYNVIITGYTTYFGMIKTKMESNRIQILGFNHRGFNKLSINTNFHKDIPKKDLCKDALLLLAMIDNLPPNFTYDFVCECIDKYVFFLNNPVIRKKEKI
jgi:hypothetical protein